MKILLLFLALCSFNFAFSQDVYYTEVVYFDFNSSVLSAEELSKLDIFEKSDSKIRIINIEAHTDTSGTTLYNNRLAGKRLNAVLAHVKYNKSNAKIIGEDDANIADSYVDSKFRKVVIDYDFPTVEEIPDPIDESIEVPVIPFDSGVDEPSLESGAAEFLKSNDATLSIDLAINFEPGTAIPLQISYAELERLVAFMKENMNLDAYLHGHVCCSNAVEMSERRAYYVYNYLIKKGIAENRLRRIGHGNTKPKVSPEVTEADRIANRRVTIMFTKQ